MPQTLTFAKVFTAEGEKNGKTWKRWDFKTEDGERYVTFNAGLANRISVNTPYTLEIEGDNKIASIVSSGSGGSAPAGNQQAGSESQNGSEAVSAAPTASQGHSGRDFAAEARGKSKFGFWQALLPVMYSSLPKAEQTVEAAAQLVDHAMGEVFPEDLPF